MSAVEAAFPPENSSSGSEDSDTEEDDSDEYTDVEEEEEEVPGEEVAGSSSDENPDRVSCPVCLNRLSGQPLGMPENCEHVFCLECITEWSKNINTCPIDRTEFNNIYVKDSPSGKTLRKVRVEVASQGPEEGPVPEEVTACEVCRLGDREHRLLLCDACDLAYHCDCLDPPLFHVPIEQWFCPPCSGVMQSAPGPSNSSQWRRRVIPRTTASEAVRSRVQRLRTNTTPQSRSTPVKRRKRSSYRRRPSGMKVVQLARTKKDMGGGGKGKGSSGATKIVLTYRRCRRRRRKKKTTTRPSPRCKSAAKTRSKIAGVLGICSPRNGTNIPDVRPPKGGAARVDKAPSCAIFGQRHQLMDFSEDFTEEPTNTSNPGTSSQSSTSSVNLLDSILAGQDLLMIKSDRVTIRSDGSLIPKAPTTLQRASSSTQSTVKGSPGTSCSTPSTSTQRVSSLTRSSAREAQGARICSLKGSQEASGSKQSILRGALVGNSSTQSLAREAQGAGSSKQSSLKGSRGAGSSNQISSSTEPAPLKWKSLVGKNRSPAPKSSCDPKSLSFFPSQRLKGTQDASYGVRSEGREFHVASHSGQRKSLPSARLGNAQTSKSASRSFGKSQVLGRKDRLERNKELKAERNDSDFSDKERRVLNKANRIGRNKEMKAEQSDSDVSGEECRVPNRTNRLGRNKDVKVEQSDSDDVSSEEQSQSLLGPSAVCEKSDEDESQSLLTESSLESAHRIKAEYLLSCVQNSKGDGKSQSSDEDSVEILKVVEPRKRSRRISRIKVEPESEDEAIRKEPVTIKTEFLVQDDKDSATDFSQSLIDGTPSNFVVKEKKEEHPVQVKQEPLGKERVDRLSGSSDLPQGTDSISVSQLTTSVQNSSNSTGLFPVCKNGRLPKKNVRFKMEDDSNAKDTTRQAVSNIQDSPLSSSQADDSTDQAIFEDFGNLPLTQLADTSGKNIFGDQNNPSPCSSEQTKETKTHNSSQPLAIQLQNSVTRSSFLGDSTCVFNNPTSNLNNLSSTQILDSFPMTQLPPTQPVPLTGSRKKSFSNGREIAPDLQDELSDSDDLPPTQRLEPFSLNQLSPTQPVIESRKRLTSKDREIAPDLQDQSSNSNDLPPTQSLESFSFNQLPPTQPVVPQTKSRLKLTFKSTEIAPDLQDQSSDSNDLPPTQRWESFSFNQLSPTQPVIESRKRLTSKDREIAPDLQDQSSNSNDLPPTQSLESFSFNHLPPTQPVVPQTETRQRLTSNGREIAPDLKGELSNSEDLPPTQRLEPFSLNQLPPTQPVVSQTKSRLKLTSKSTEIASDLQDQSSNSNDLPPTQSLESFSFNQLPPTQPVVPQTESRQKLTSKGRITPDLEDQSSNSNDLPPTQSLESFSFNQLPPTQPVVPQTESRQKLTSNGREIAPDLQDELSNSEDLPPTQRLEPFSLNQLPPTQPVVSQTKSRLKLTSKSTEIAPDLQDQSSDSNDLPPTQRWESFSFNQLSPTQPVIESRKRLTSKDREIAPDLHDQSSNSNDLPPTQSLESFSFNQLPPTQPVVPQSESRQKLTSKGRITSDPENQSSDSNDLPPTQSLESFSFNQLPPTQPVVPQTESRQKLTSKGRITSDLDDQSSNSIDLRSQMTESFPIGQLSPTQPVVPKTNPSKTTTSKGKRITPDLEDQSSNSNDLPPTQSFESCSLNQLPPTQPVVPQTESRRKIASKGKEITSALEDQSSNKKEKSSKVGKASTFQASKGTPPLKFGFNFSKNSDPPSSESEEDNNSADPFSEENSFPEKNILEEEVNSAKIASKICGKNSNTSSNKASEVPCTLTDVSTRDVNVSSLNQTLCIEPSHNALQSKDTGEFTGVSDSKAPSDAPLPSDPCISSTPLDTLNCPEDPLTAESGNDLVDDGGNTPLLPETVDFDDLPPTQAFAPEEMPIENGLADAQSSDPEHMVGRDPEFYNRLLKENQARKEPVPRGVHQNLPQVIVSRRVGPLPKPPGRLTFSFDQAREKFGLPPREVLQRGAFLAAIQKSKPDSESDPPVDCKVESDCVSNYQVTCKTEPDSVSNSRVTCKTEPDSVSNSRVTCVGEPGSHFQEAVSGPVKLEETVLLEKIKQELLSEEEEEVATLEGKVNVELMNHSKVKVKSEEDSGVCDQSSSEKRSRVEDKIKREKMTSNGSKGKNIRDKETQKYHDGSKSKLSDHQQKKANNSDAHDKARSSHEPHHISKKKSNQCDAELKEMHTNKGQSKAKHSDKYDKNSKGKHGDDSKKKYSDEQDKNSKEKSLDKKDSRKEKSHKQDKNSKDINTDQHKDSKEKHFNKCSEESRKKHSNGLDKDSKEKHSDKPSKDLQRKNSPEHDRYLKTISEKPECKRKNLNECDKYSERNSKKQDSQKKYSKENDGHSKNHYDRQEYKGKNYDKQGSSERKNSNKHIEYSKKNSDRLESKRKNSDEHEECSKKNSDREKSKRKYSNEKDEYSKNHYDRQESKRKKSEENEEYSKKNSNRQEYSNENAEYSKKLSNGQESKRKNSEPDKHLKQKSDKQESKKKNHCDVDSRSPKHSDDHRKDSRKKTRRKEENGVDSKNSRQDRIKEEPCQDDLGSIVKLEVPSPGSIQEEKVEKWVKRKAESSGELSQSKRLRLSPEVTLRVTCELGLRENHRKIQEGGATLKERIAAEVKAVLKPFYGLGVLDKEDYKDVMRRAVPKIFMNCNNCVNPEKIKKLVLGYMSMMKKP